MASALIDAVERAPDPKKEPSLVDVTRLLQCYGQRVDARDHDGSTALHSAALGGHVSLVSLLLAHGADVHARDRSWPIALFFLSP